MSRQKVSKEIRDELDRQDKVLRQRWLNKRVTVHCKQRNGSVIDRPGKVTFVNSLSFYGNCDAMEVHLDDGTILGTVAKYVTLQA